jgi:cobalt-precorrin-5B (C1)-methyltransferase
MEKYVYKNGKKMRYGYTTGSCSAGAAKAATYMLLNQKSINNITIDTPKGWVLNLDVVDGVFTKNYGICAIVKDSGDDPDITNGIKVYAKVTIIDEEKINIFGGKGVGTVTKDGLSIPIGESAINPVPREMIKNEVLDILKNFPNVKGLNVEISIPQGEEIAKRTFNPKLGIVGGISVIGTSGIVEPMSEESFKKSLSLELNVLAKKGYTSVIFVPGNYGKDFCEKLELDIDKLVKISNFIGYMFEQAVSLGFKKILLVGHIGKLIKVAGGIFHTHSRVADGRMDILVSHLLRTEANISQLRIVLDSNTTEEAVKYIKDENLEDVFPLIVKSIKDRLECYVYDQLSIEVILFSSKEGLLGMTEGATKLMKEFINE